MNSFTGVQALVTVMQRLRDPVGGCPWDLQQSMASLIPYTLEEAYEVAAAITAGEPAAIKDELGDLLFQVVFYAQLGKEQELFDLDAIAKATAEKLMRRHPHVFGEQQALSDAEIKAQWEQIKSEERAEQGQSDSVFDGIADNLPSILMAQKLQKRAATVGFDWSEMAPVIAKIREELAEVEDEIRANDNAKIAAEIGDLLFAVVNLARHAQVNPEHALRLTNHKFKQRFQWIETQLAQQQRRPEELSLDELETYWQQAKQQLNHVESKK